MIKRPGHMRGFALMAAALCAGCASVMQGSLQDVTVLTPGANNAECKLSVGSVEYIYTPPMTRSIQKSGDNMVVNCWAPGNRHKVVHLKPDITGPTLYNAPPGLAWDLASRAAYAYPSVVEVDFSQTQVRPFPLPAQNQPDIRPPEDYDLEEFNPGLPRLNSDRFATKTEVRRRQVPTDFDLQGFSGYESQTGTPPDMSGPPAAQAPAASGAAQSSPTRRIIGRMNEGVAVPAPPSAAEQAASSAARAAESAADAAAASSEAAQQASEAAGNSAGSSSESPVVPTGNGGTNGGAENLIPPE